ncbi:MULTISPECIES: GGDEF domain-containing protein [Spirulina sp. CCY15215]|uniref:GGDEF domain-containing protein n=1 Tax=Spirulina sp. CCY15215 TaxID=2767591 RepID=UPI0019515C96|nr:GGDEF domain-containing protein [Spirulina major]
MNISVLLIGSKNFITTFLERYETPIVAAIESTSKAEIIAGIAQNQPDIVLLEADLLSILGLCCEIKKTNYLGLVYCIAIEYYCSANILEREPSQHLLETAKAIENSADAYLQFSGLDSSINQNIEAEKRLLLAYLQVAYRQVQQYRELLKTNDFLSSIALADALTDLSNRRALEWDLPRQVEKARKKNIPLSLAILDVDYFKSVNDNHGHLVGDRILQLLAYRLRNNIREQDTVFRYGGEEFVILFQQTNTDTAMAIAHQLCQIISETPFNIDRNLTLSLTISLGLSSLQPEDDDRGRMLLKRADLNLLKAKSSGRDRVVG